jgi:hypothetical protein
MLSLNRSDGFQRGMSNEVSGDEEASVSSTTMTLPNNNNNSLIPHSDCDRANEAAASPLSQLQRKIRNRGIDAINDGPFRFQEVVCRDERRYDIPSNEKFGIKESIQSMMVPFDFRKWRVGMNGDTICPCHIGTSMTEAFFRKYRTVQVGVPVGFRCYRLDLLYVPVPV